MSEVKGRGGSIMMENVVMVNDLQYLCRAIVIFSTPLRQNTLNWVFLKDDFYCKHIFPLFKRLELKSTSKIIASDPE